MGNSFSILINAKQGYNTELARYNQWKLLKLTAEAFGKARGAVKGETIFGSYEIKEIDTRQIADIVAECKP